VASGALDFDNLPADDEEAIAELTRIKGIGRWSAEIYLLFAEGRPDIWPAGDLAVQAGLGKILACPSARTKRPPARWPKAGARTAARWRSSPGIVRGSAGIIVQFAQGVAASKPCER
jgi:DNA-3-methyladenine glycosylase II